MITNDKINRIKDTIISNINPIKIILIGSYAQGNPSKGSDLDLLIIEDSNDNPHQRALRVRKLFPDRNFGLDVMVFTPDDENKFKDIKGSILYSALKTGKILYER